MKSTSVNDTNLRVMLGGAVLLLLGVAAYFLVISGLPATSDLTGEQMAYGMMAGNPAAEQALEQAVEAIAWRNENQWKLWVAMGTAFVGLTTLVVGAVRFRSARPTVPADSGSSAASQVTSEIGA